MYKRSIEDPAGFWAEVASQFCWKEKWHPEVYAENIDVRKGTVKIEVSILSWCGTVFISDFSCFSFKYKLIDVNPVGCNSQWFKGANTNICYNALDRNVEAGNGGKVAIYWEGNEPGQDGQLTYAELLDKVCQVCSYSSIIFFYFSLSRLRKVGAMLVHLHFFHDSSPTT